MVRNNKGTRTYPAGTFFRGLGRPWMGLHAIDTVRRDALLCGSTVQMEGSDQDTARVKVQEDQAVLVYDVAMQQDLIEQVRLQAGSTEGQLEWSYPETAAVWSDQMPYVDVTSSEGLIEGLWLMEWIRDGGDGF